MLSASVTFVDGFAGLSDPRSLATIVEGVAPRALALVGASGPDTAKLADACHQVMLHKLGQTIKLYQPGEALRRGRGVATERVWRVCVQAIPAAECRHS
jgi:hypothetical protein